MPIPANQQINFEIVYQGNVASAGSTSRAWQPVWHYRRTTTVNPIVKTAIATAFDAQVRAALMAILSLRLTTTQYLVRCLDDAQDAYTPSTSARVGLVAGDSMAMTCASYFEFKTGLRGRSFRGSKHFFPHAESQTTLLTEDLWNAGTLANMVTLATAMVGQFADANGNVWQPVVLSKKLSQLVTNPTNVVVNDVTSIAVNKRVGVMRHRRVKSVY